MLIKSCFFLNQDGVKITSLNKSAVRDPDAVSSCLSLKERSMWGIPTCTPSAGSSSPPRRSCPLPACGWDVAPRRATPSPTRVRGCGRRRCVQSPLRSLCTRVGPAVSVTSKEHTLLSSRREGSDGSLGQDRYYVASGGNFQNKGSFFISEMKKQSVMWKVPRSHTWIN